MCVYILRSCSLRRDECLLAETCIGIAPNYDVAHLILGLCYIGKGDKEKGLESIRKAQELGNEQATALIEKYK